MPSPTNINSQDAVFIELVGRSLRGTQGSTLEEIITSDVIIGFSNDGALSKPQRGLIAAVVSLMQDRIIDELRINASDLRQALQDQRLLSFAGFRMVAGNLRVGASEIYKTPLPLIGRTSVTTTPSSNGKIRRFLNWGNFTTVVSVLLLCLAIFYTKAFASYKDRVEAQKGLIDDLQASVQQWKHEIDHKQAQLVAVQEQYKKADEQAIYWRAAAETTQGQINKANENLEAAIKKAGASDALVNANKEIEQLNSNSIKSQAKISQLEAWKTQSFQESSTYRELWEKTKDALQRSETRAISLNNENTQLTKENDKLRDQVAQHRR